MWTWLLYGLVTVWIMVLGAVATLAFRFRQREEARRRAENVASRDRPVARGPTLSESRHPGRKKRKRLL